MTDAYDADALLYAAAPEHPPGQRVAARFRAAPPGDLVGTGSVLLLPEVLSKPMREGAASEVRVLASLLARLDLRPTDRATAELSTVLAAKYGLGAADAVHLASAVHSGADRFITHNTKDFTSAITELAITVPDQV